VPALGGKSGKSVDADFPGVLQT